MSTTFITLSASSHLQGQRVRIRDYQFWNRAQGKSNLMSYQKRMKHHVVLTKMHILDINNSNKHFLSMFRQGVNSNGKLREPKIMIDHDMISKFSICDVTI